MAGPKSENCPKCGKEHFVGKYYRHENDIDINGLGEVQKPKTCVAPNDVECECGLTLRFVVPIFKESDSGFRLIIKPDKASLRKSSTELK